MSSLFFKAKTEAIHYNTGLNFFFFGHQNSNSTP